VVRHHHREVRRQRNMKWTTLIPPERSRRYRPDDVHAAIYVPRDWAGNGPVVVLQIPSCALACGQPGEIPVIIRRPQQNCDIAFWVDAVCEEAWPDRAAIVFSCNTEHQAEAVAAAAASMLPNYERLPIERLGGAIRARLS